MTKKSKNLFAGAAVTGLLLAGQAHAQQNLSGEEVRGFFDSMEREAVQAVRAGEWERLLDWTENRLAGGATFFLSQEIYVDDERKGFTVTSLDKQDMLQLSRVALGFLSGMQGQAVQDYALEIEVLEVDPVGPNAATATTRITESGKFALPGGEGGQQDSPAMEFEATADCQHLIQRDRAAGQLVMGLTNCQARTRL